MYELKYKRKRRRLPSIYELEREEEERYKEEREEADKEWLKNRLLHSEEPVDRIAVKAVAAGLISYVRIEEVRSSHGYEHKKGWFGHTTDREWHSRSVRRTIVER